MEAPYVGPVGLTVVPPGFVQTPRRRAPGLRLAAALLLAVFAATVVVTSVRSLGAWCLTTRAADTRGLPTRAGTR